MTAPMRRMRKIARLLFEQLDVGYDRFSVPPPTGNDTRHNVFFDLSIWDGHIVYFRLESYFTQLGMVIS